MIKHSSLFCYPSHVTPFSRTFIPLLLTAESLNFLATIVFNTTHRQPSDRCSHSDVCSYRINDVLTPLSNTNNPADMFFISRLYASVSPTLSSALFHCNCLSPATGYYFGPPSADPPPRP